MTQMDNTKKTLKQNIKATNKQHTIQINTQTDCLSEAFLLAETDSLHPFLPQQGLFRAYDIRGDYRYFTNDFVQALANSLVAFYQSRFNQISNQHLNQDSSSNSSHKPKIVIGYDMRHGSLHIAKQLAIAYLQAGFQVLWLGLVTTPMMAYWASQQETANPNNQADQNGIMVTASHSAKNITGIKWLCHGQSPTTADIQAIYQQMATQKPCIQSNQQIANQWHAYQSQLTIIDNPQSPYLQGIEQAISAIKPRYQADIHNNSQKNKQGNKLVNTLVVDCLHGTTANFAKELFQAYAEKVILLNATANGNFPKGNPDPCEEGRLDELQSAVTYYQADLGLAFDGDGDRMMVVDNTARVLDPDNLLYLLAKSALAKTNLAKKALTKTNLEKSEVIFDVKCSHHLPTMLTHLGATPIMSKTGSSHMRHSMQTGKSRAIFAGELSGHFIFNDGLFINHDDAMYAGVRLLTWLSTQKQSLANIVDQLPTMVSTADTYIKVEQRQSLIQRLIGMLKDWLQNTAKLELPSAMVNSLPKDARLCTIDGIRLDFQHGFGVIRQSNTSQSLTVRFAGNSIADLKKIQQYFVKICQQIDEQLAKAIAKIQPVGG